MLQVSFIRENQDKVLEGLKKRNFKQPLETIEKVLVIDEDRRKTQAELDSKLSESNQLSKEIGLLMKAGKIPEADQIKAKTASLKETTKDLQHQLSRIENELNDLLLSIPNLPHESVVYGTSEADNEVVHEWGPKLKLDESALPHWELVKVYDIIDFELGNKITGAGFPVYKGKGARLQRALINFFLDQAQDQGYLEIQPPVVINEDSGYGTGQLPDKEGQMYQLTDEQFYLIPTAEVPITNLYRNEIIPDEQLPIKNVGYSLCFRREAGSWGTHVRGLNRLHQFDKVEIVQIQKPEHSYQALDAMCKYVQSLLEKLELPYRKLRLCGFDLGFTSSLTYDMEVWSAAQQKWLEVSSVSNFENYQANRLKLRYRTQDGKNRLLHTLNGSALALPRVMAALLENNQQTDGINVPSVLLPYTGFDIIKAPDK